MLKRLLLISLLCVCTLSHAKEQFFKYVDKDGNTIITNNLPAEYANNGYAIVTARGNVLEIIPPKKTEEELAQELAKEKARFEEQQRKKAIKQAQLKQKRRDEILLKTFASENAIIRNRDDKVRSIEVLEDITKENISRLQDQLNQAENTAAQYERSGKLTPKTVIHTIEESKRQISENLDFLDNKAQEKSLIKAKYQEMIERFRHLSE